MSLIERVRASGVVGAGGGGFPAHVKLDAKADTVIANGAECEPLLHKDGALLEHSAAQVVEGLRLAMESVGARDGLIGVKAKNKQAIEALRQACVGTKLRVHLLADCYPSGDEYELVPELTGRLIPPAGIPPQVGVVVSNVETLINIAAASRGQPVVRKTLTVAGAVRKPTTLTVPLGTSWRECIEAAGGPTSDDTVLCIGGVMMGTVTDDLSTPVTKTMAGAVVLPRRHPVIQRKLRPAESQRLIGRSACDQCRYCTEYCPRFLLGYAVEPHQVMRSLGFTGMGQDLRNSWAALCCSCGLCTLYACPEELFPREACELAKAEFRAAGLIWVGRQAVRVHPMRDGRRVPTPRLVKRLQLQAFDAPAPLTREELAPRQVTLLLKQHAGAPCLPTVRTGDPVVAGQLIGSIAEGALGAALHAPFPATVSSLSPTAITLTRMPCTTMP